MQSVKVRSYAKLNLSLDVVGEENGYHMLDSVVCSVDIYDSIIVRARRDKLINVYMRGLGSEAIPPEKNNAAKAGEAFVSSFGTRGADITVLKDIPMGAGLGGSSADAAGVINAMAKLYGVNDAAALKEIADGLGSDTGYMLTGGFARLQGRGERIQSLSTSAELDFLLILPDTGVSTPACFKRYDELAKAYPPAAQAMEEALCFGSFARIGANIKNDLSQAAAALNPDVAAALKQAESFSPLGYGMSGSGSSVFALFENREFCAWAQSRYKGKFKTRVARSVVPQERQKKPVRSLYSLTEDEERLK